MMRLAELAEWCGGELVGADGPVRGAGIDSRALPAGALFAALRGARRDGHDFAADCADRAAGCLVARRLELGVPQIVVDDPAAALQTIAARWRARLRARVAAVTGSNGKTTTKEMARAALAAAGRCAASPGNWNNHLGVPLALLGIAEDDDYAVLELGASRPGEIARLAAWARPDAAAVTGAAEAHLEGFGDLDGVAAAKAEIYAGLGADGAAVVNADDRYADFWRARAAPRRVIDFGAAADAAVRARLGDGELELACGGETARVDWPLAGAHNALNAACAVALALGLGIGFRAAAAALAGFELPVAGRLRFARGPGGARLIDDSYNANPGSFRAAIDVLVGQAAETWVVMGEMRELGAASDAQHAAVARYARDAGVGRLLALGPRAERCARAFGAGGEACAGVEQAAAVLRRELRAGCAVLVKGSRAARLERLVARLAEPEEAAHAA